LPPAISSLVQRRGQAAAASSKATAEPLHVQAPSASQHAGTASSVPSVMTVATAHVSGDTRYAVAHVKGGKLPATHVAFRRIGKKPSAQLIVHAPPSAIVHPSAQLGSSAPAKGTGAKQLKLGTHVALSQRSQAPHSPHSCTQRSSRHVHPAPHCVSAVHGFGPRSQTKAASLLVQFVGTSPAFTLEQPLGAGNAARAVPASPSRYTAAQLPSP
jgi:hypothetical protein